MTHLLVGKPERCLLGNNRSTTLQFSLHNLGPVTPLLTAAYSLPSFLLLVPPFPPSSIHRVFNPTMSARYDGTVDADDVWKRLEGADAKGAVPGRVMQNDYIRETLKKRIMVFDGGMGTMVQMEGLTEDDFRCTRHKNHTHPLQGNNDVLVLSRPDLIYKIHRQYVKSCCT